MNKSELVAIAAEYAGISKKDTERVLNGALDAAIRALAAGDKVQITNFGTFEAKQRKAKVGRNPVTRESMEIPATRVAVFKASKSLKEIMEK